MRYISIVFFLIVSYSNLFSNHLELSEDQKEYLKNNPVLTAGYTKDFEPLYIQKSDGSVEGIIPDLYNIIASKLGIKIEYKTNTWLQSIQDTVEGKIDFIPLMSPKTAKENNLLTSDNVYSHLFRVFGKKQRGFRIDSMDDLKGLRVAYVKNIIVLDKFLQEYKTDFSLVESNNAFDAFEKVLNNKADVAIVFNTNGYYMIKNKYLSELEPLYLLEQLQIYSVNAVTPKKPILQDIFNNALASISYEDKLKIYEKWTKGSNKTNNQLDLLLTKEEKEYLKNKKVIRIHAENDWAPYNFVKNGIATGFSSDYLKLIFKTLNKDIEFVQGYSWNEFMGLLENKQIDIISNMAITDERKNKYIFSHDYMFSSYKSLFYSNKHSQLGIDDLDGKKLALVEGYYEENIIKKYYPKINIVKAKNNLEMIQYLLNNDVDAVIGNTVVIRYLLEENFITSINSSEVINKYFPLKPNHLAFNKDDKILSSIVSKAINATPKEKIDQLKKRWFENISKHSVLTIEEQKYLEDSSFTIYYNNRGWYPFVFKEDGIVKGISIDFWAELFSDTRVNVKYVGKDSFSEVLTSIKNDPFAIVGATSGTKDRKSYASFSKPFASFPVAIATNVKEDFLLDLKELEGKTVAVGKNYTAHTLLKRYYPKINFVPVSGVQEALSMLANGQVYAAADILPVLNYELSRYSYSSLKISGTSKFNFDVQIMVNKKSEKLIAIINKLIDNINQDKKQDILNKWIHFSKIERVDYTLAYWITAISLMVIIFILYRQAILKKQKKQIEIEVKAATKELKELNIIHEDTQHLAKIATMKKDLLTKKYWVSKEFYNIFELDKNIKIDTKLILEKIVDEDKPRLEKFFKKNENFQNRFSNKDSLIIRLKLLENKIKYIEIYLSYIFDENHWAIERRATIQDITEKMLAKKEKDKQDAMLIQQSKLASMGEMIGAIAHQWRQPLNELGIRIQKLKYKYKNEEINEEFINTFIDKNKQTISFMSKTIDDFRNFFRIDKVKKEFSIKESIVDVISILASQLKNHFIEIEFDGGDFVYNGFKTEFQQVLINLISNSKDAILSNNIKDPKILIKVSGNCIILEDNAGGIDEEIISRVFEPYFTTKEQGEGTGMGMYLSKMIIEDNMSGKIDIENINNGIRVSIRLGE